jgi:hypothetical protein
VNGRTLGIELVSTPGMEPFSDIQLHGGPLGPGLEGLVRRLAEEYGITVDEDHVLTHSDVCPRSRTTKGGEPWGPPSSKYSFEAIFETIL